MTHKTDLDRIDRATSMDALSDIARDVRARMDIEGASEADPRSGGGSRAQSSAPAFDPSDDPDSIPF